jgi:hypothetical protein
MADVIFLALTAMFFAASFGIVHLFERLREHKRAASTRSA